MPRNRVATRRFAIADLMVLIAATCVAMPVIRLNLAALFNNQFSIRSELRTIETCYAIWSPLAACWMLALLLLWTRPPRPRRGRLARQPGYVACFVAAVALVVGSLVGLGQYALRDWKFGPFVFPHGNFGPLIFREFWITASVPVRPAVLGAWLLLALSGRWRADPGWMDRLGRLLGWCWIGWHLLWLIHSPVSVLIPAL